MADVVGVTVAPLPVPVGVEEGAEGKIVVVGGKKNRIQVSNKKKPLFFYVNLAKRYMQQHNEVELSALGMAIATVVTISEILKNNGFATEEKILTSTVDMKDENNGRLIQKAKIEILLKKSENFESLVDTASPEQKAVEEKKDSGTHEVEVATHEVEVAA